MRNAVQGLWRLCRAAARAARDVAADPAHAAELAGRSLSLLRSQDLGVALGLRSTSYAEWIRRFEPGPEELRLRLQRLSRRPRITVVVPSRTDAARTVASVRAQIYGEWQLLVAGDNLGRLERLTEIATGELVAVVDPSAELAPHALLELAETLVLRPDAELLTCDEDRRDSRGLRTEPCFKPRLDVDLLQARDYVSHFAPSAPRS